MGRKRRKTEAAKWGFHRGVHESERLKAAQGAPPAFETCDLAVVDIETTGVGRTDRIIEIAVVRFDTAGSYRRDWVTLLNPARDLGKHAHRIHGLDTFDEIKYAPRFRDILGDLAELLQGAVLVAHNLPFERRFLQHEFDLLGLAFPEVPGLCTLGLGSSMGAPSRRLDLLCQHFGIALPGHHCAMQDAQATSALVALYLMMSAMQGYGSLASLGITTPHPPSTEWPSSAPSGAAYIREAANLRRFAETPNSYLSRLVARLPSDASEHEAEYLGLLDNVLADFQVTVKEAAALQDFAVGVGLETSDRVRLNEGYMIALVDAAWEDGVVTEDEMNQLRMVARVLGIAESRLLEVTMDRKPPSVAD